MTMIQQVKGIARASNYAIGRGDANNGLNDKDDKGNTSFIKDVTGYDSIGDMFDGGGKECQRHLRDMVIFQT